jgi:hypothetical protein
MRRIKYKSGNGKAEVELEGEALGLVDRMLRGAPARVADTIESAVADIAANARERWPVGPAKKKGTHSRDEIENYLRVGGDSIEGVVINAADYAIYVRSWKNGLLGKSAWQELIRKPGLDMASFIAKDIAADLIRLADGGA